MYEISDELEHYGRLGMKWHQHRFKTLGRKADRREKRAALATEAIKQKKDEIKTHKKALKSENARDIKNQAKLQGSKNDIRVRKEQLDKGDFGILFRGKKKRQAEKALDAAKDTYREAVNKDVAIKSNQAKIRANILSGQDSIQRYRSERSAHLDKAAKYRGKQALRKQKLDIYISEMNKQKAEKEKKRAERANRKQAAK